MKTLEQLLSGYTGLHYAVESLERAADWSAMATSLQPSEAVVWLDSARTHAVTGRYSILALKPWLSMECSDFEGNVRTSSGQAKWRGPSLPVLQQCLNRFRLPNADASHRAPLPQALALFTALGYALNHEIEPRVSYRGSEGLPDLCAWGMQRVFVQDHQSGRAWAIGIADPFDPLAGLDAARKELRFLIRWNQEWLSRMRSDIKVAVERPKDERLQEIIPIQTREQFMQAVLNLKEDIARGEIFQANLAQEFTADMSVDAGALYRELRRINPSPFACFVRHPQWSIVSCSPERLVRVEDGTVEARPIAGTRPRGGSAEEDALQGIELVMSEKDRAEHIMLVDLARNDIGRLCRPGSVSVDELLGLEHYSHVIHIVSNVTGKLRPEVESAEIIRSLFPGGTITGCPKVRCMQILADTEPVPRGFYTGSVGYFGLNGDMDLNILIRTITLQAHKLSFHVGAGIVADSSPEREYFETLDKGKALINALNGLVSGNAQARTS